MRASALLDQTRRIRGHGRQRPSGGISWTRQAWRGLLRREPSAALAASLAATSRTPTPPKKPPCTRLTLLAPRPLRQAFPEYGRDDDFKRVRDGFQLLLAECAEAENTWPATLDRFEGRHQVPLMTIHKSKGLEFHTMVFFGLDDRTWRGLQLAEDEELNAFFVAFTRAKQRAFFTSCS
jgi:hypothetical protein